MKQIGLLLIMVMMIVGCSSPVSSDGLQVFEVVDQSLDVMKMIEYRDQLYLGTNEGLFIMEDNKVIKSVDLVEPLSIIHTLYVAEDNQLYIGGMNGLIVMNHEGDQIYYDEEEDWLPDTRVLYVTGNEEGTLYIGTFSGVSILKLDSMSAEVFTEKDGLMVPMVNRIVPTQDGSLWLASYNVREGGMTRIKDGQVTYYKDELATTHITSVLYEDDVLYFGGGVYDEGGLTKFEYDGEQWHITDLFYLEDGFAGAKVRSLYKQDDRLFIGSEYSGLAIWDGDERLIYTEKNGLTHNEVKCIYNYKGDILIGTRNGLSRLLE